MKVVILAGGLGTRLTEETGVRPKPMVEIGGEPILWHIMKIYSHFGLKDFIILCGYKQEVIKEYFHNYLVNKSDIEVDLKSGACKVASSRAEPWNVTLVYTGSNTQTGGRIFKARKYIGNERFLLTYGDGVADIDINALISYHIEHGKLCTVTAVQPGERFGRLEINEDGTVTGFKEKPRDSGVWVSGGFFVCEPSIFNYIQDDDSMPFEQKPLRSLAADSQLAAFCHHGFWRPMDMLKDKIDLNSMWSSGSAPWKIWED